MKRLLSKSTLWRFQNFLAVSARCLYDRFKLFAKSDGFVKSPTSALRFISLSLRRTLCTPHDTKFARLEFVAFYFAIAILTFYEIVKIDVFD